MRRIRQFALPVVVALVTLAAADTASAGEPFHPIWQPIIDFFGGFRWF